MLFNFPSFISTKEQTKSELLFNNVRFVLQTSVEELWTDLKFGTKIRGYIKQGIDNITIAEIREEIYNKLMFYFTDDLEISVLDIQQDVNVLHVKLDYIELKTGKHYTLQSEEDIINNIY